MAKGTPVAQLQTTHLLALLGDKVTVKRSEKENGKYPLYLSTCCGPIFLNTRPGQDLILEHGEFYSSASEQDQAIAVTEAANDQEFDASQETTDEPLEVIEDETPGTPFWEKGFDV